jgi:hypothetical protein
MNRCIKYAVLASQEKDSAGLDVEGNAINAKKNLLTEPDSGRKFR